MALEHTDGRAAFASRPRQASSRAASSQRLVTQAEMPAVRQPRRLPPGCPQSLLQRPA